MKRITLAFDTNEAFEKERMRLHEMNASIDTDHTKKEIYIEAKEIAYLQIGIKHQAISKYQPI